LGSVGSRVVARAHGGPLTVSEETSWYRCFLVGTMGIVLVSQQLHLQMVRADFQRRFQLEEETTRIRELLDCVAVVRHERQNWLKSLARFLRHELKNQVAVMGTSLDLLERSPLAAPPDRYLDRARRSLARMNCLVQSPTEATSLQIRESPGSRFEVRLPREVT